MGFAALNLSYRVADSLGQARRDICHRSLQWRGGLWSAHRLFLAGDTMVRLKTNSFIRTDVAYAALMKSRPDRSGIPMRLQSH
jgi:hypothetical protein